MKKTAIALFAMASVAAAQDRLEDLRRGTPNGAWRSTYEPLPSRTTVIRNASIWTAAGRELSDADLLIRDGKIAAIGQDLRVPSGTVEIDGAGRVVTPGLIDTPSCAKTRPF